MAWREVGGGNFLKWSTPGQSIEGRWAGQRDGKYGPIGSMDTSTGRWTFPLHTALASRIEEIDPQLGDLLKITYKGKETAKGSGNEFKAFSVCVDEDQANAKAAAKEAGGAAEPAANGDEIPF